MDLSNYKMPSEYVGKTSASGARKWTDKEVEFCKYLKTEINLTTLQISECINRPYYQCELKFKRIWQAEDKYNKPYRDLKYSRNFDFLLQINPSSVLDVFSGPKSFYEGNWEVISNDKHFDGSSSIHYKMDALKFLCKMYSENKSFDLIDLDPYGGAYDCFDLAIKMARKGVVITFGEMGHIRWRRYDYVRGRYGISSVNDFTLQNMVDKVVMIGENNKKKLTPFLDVKLNKAHRVYFLVEKMKVPYNEPITPETK